jgi:hypothetical protein
VSKLAANIVGSLLTVVLCLAGVMLAQFLPHHVSFAPWHGVALLVAFVLLMPVHEGLHAVGLLLFGRVQRQEIRFGVMWHALMPYCHCTVPIPLHAYRRMALLPLWVTGSFSTAALLLYPADAFGIFAGVAVAACVGDVWMIARLRSFSDSLLVQDSPSAIGCDILAPATNGAE